MSHKVDNFVNVFIREENAILKLVNAPAKQVGLGLIARDLVEKTRLGKNAETNAIASITEDAILSLESASAVLVIQAKLARRNVIIGSSVKIVRSNAFVRNLKRLLAILLLGSVTAKANTMEVKR